MAGLPGQYEAPELTLVGSLEGLTAAVSGGTRLDRGFSAGTPLGDITTS